MKKKIASIIGLIILISSCSKNYSYDCVVKNDTNYLLEQVKFDFNKGNNGKIITILPNNKTSTFSLSYKMDIEYGAGPGTLQCEIKTWSDSEDVFTNTINSGISGVCLSSELSETEINYFTIKLLSDTIYIDRDTIYNSFETTMH